MKHNRSNFDYRFEVDHLINVSKININLFHGKRILITGGTGFFGIWILFFLVRIKDKLNGKLELTVISRDPDQFIKKNIGIIDFKKVSFIRGDIKKVKIAGSKYTHLLHMASTSANETFSGECQIKKIELLYEGTRNILEQCNGEIESVLFTSSGVAYGVNNNELISESDFSGINTLLESSALGLGKTIAEYLVAYYAESFNYNFSIARCFSFAGPYLPLNIHYAFGNFIRNAKNSEPIVINGDGKSIRSYLYVGDACAWLLRMLIEPKNNIYNVGSQISINILQLAELILHVGNIKAPIIIKAIENKDANFERLSYVPSTKKIRDAYPGLKEWTTTRDIISKMML